MASTTIARRRNRAATPPTKPPAPTPWWGAGEAPHVRWPGVTIAIEAAWSKARARWETRDKAYYFDVEAADFAADFFPTFLRHHIGEFDGQPFELLDYQRYIVRAAWGWKRASDGLRRFRKVFLAIPKANGKSPFGSGVGLLMTFFDREPGAEVYAVAADKDQARIVFDTSKIMVSRSPELQDLCEVFRDSIKLKGSTESYQVLSSDSDTKHGFRPHGIVFDEFHAQPNRDLFDTLYRGMGKRRQPLLLMVTTAGDDDESICMEEWEYARRVVSGTIDDPQYLPVIFEAAPEDDWTDEAVWRRVNPGYDITIKADYFHAEAAAAQREPRKRNSFLQLHLNRWTNQATAWLPIEWWDACPTVKAAAALLAAVPQPWIVAAGLDLAQKIDLAAFVVGHRLPLEEGILPELVEVVKEEPDGQVQRASTALNFRALFVPYFWLPEDTLRDRERQDGVPYSVWRDAGFLRVTPGSVIDYDQIYRDITAEIGPRHGLKGAEIAYDPAFATQLANQLASAGFRPVEVPQNYRHFSEPCQIFEALVRSQRAINDGNRVMRWCVENVAIRKDDAERIRPVKPRKSGKRIDGVVAGVMALSRLMVAPQPAAPFNPEIMVLS